MASNLAGEMSFYESARQEVAAKRAIARRLVAEVQKGEALLMGWGSTVLAVAEELLTSQRRDVTVFTNSIPLASRIAASAPDAPQLVLLGGPLHWPSLASLPEEETLARLHVDKAVLSCTGISAEYGWAAGSVALQTYHLMMAAARETWVVADHTKISKRGLAIVGPIDEIHCLVTDRAEAEGLEAIRARGVRVLTPTQ